MILTDNNKVVAYAYRYRGGGSEYCHHHYYYHHHIYYLYGIGSSHRTVLYRSSELLPESRE